MFNPQLWVLVVDVAECVTATSCFLKRIRVDAYPTPEGGVERNIGVSHSNHFLQAFVCVGMLLGVWGNTNVCVPNCLMLMCHLVWVVCWCVGVVCENWRVDASIMHLDAGLCGLVFGCVFVFLFFLFFVCSLVCVFRLWSRAYGGCLGMLSR